MAGEVLNEWASKIRGLRELGVESAKEATPLVLAAVKATAKAGTTATGEAWQPKKDGGRALVNAAAALSGVAVGAAIEIVLTGVEVIHNFGDKRNPKRTILPEGGAGIPQPIADAAKTGSERAFARLMRGRS